MIFPFKTNNSLIEILGLGFIAIPLYWSKHHMFERCKSAEKLDETQLIQFCSIENLSERVKWDMWVRGYCDCELSVETLHD